jgi:hypothetical protein
MRLLEIDERRRERSARWDIECATSKFTPAPSMSEDPVCNSDEDERNRNGESKRHHPMR